MKLNVIQNKFVIQITSMTEAMSCDALNLVICDENLNPIDIDSIREDWYNNWIKCIYAILSNDYYKNWTVLYSSYAIGQKVYFMRDNKIVEGTIKNIVLATGDMESSAVIRYKTDTYEYSFNEFSKTPNELVSKLLHDFNNENKK